MKNKGLEILNHFQKRMSGKPKKLFEMTKKSEHKYVAPRNWKAYST